MPDWFDDSRSVVIGDIREAIPVSKRKHARRHRHDPDAWKLAAFDGKRGRGKRPEFTRKFQKGQGRR